MAAALVAGTALAAPPPYQVQFGLFDRKGILTPGHTLWMGSRQGYGWIGTVSTKGWVHWREILTLPYPPHTWGGLPSFDSPLEYGAVSPDKRTSVTEGDALPQGRHISHGWDLAPGDPVGIYRMTVIFNGKIAGTFRFEARR